jgi:hypothetical protein
LSFLFGSNIFGFRFDMNIFSSTRKRDDEKRSRALTERDRGVDVRRTERRKVRSRSPSSKSRKERSSVPSSDGTAQVAIRPKAPKPSQYPYEKLDFDTSEIRVLKLTGRDHSFHSSITIRHISLIDPPPYYALSYVRTSGALELPLRIFIALHRLYSICSRCFSSQIHLPYLLIRHSLSGNN